MKTENLGHEDETLCEGHWTLFSSARKWDVSFSMTPQCSEKCLRFIFLLNDLSLLSYFFFNTVLYISGCPLTHSAARNDLELPACTSWRLRLQPCATTVFFFFFFTQGWCSRPTASCVLGNHSANPSCTQSPPFMFNGHVLTATEKMSFSVLLPWKLDPAWVKMNKWTAWGVVCSQPHRALSGLCCGLAVFTTQTTLNPVDSGY